MSYSTDSRTLLFQQLGLQNVQPTEECFLHHTEAVYDQDQEAGETPKS